VREYMDTALAERVLVPATNTPSASA
jgi:hypothetical protein